MDQALKSDYGERGGNITLITAGGLQNSLDVKRRRQRNVGSHSKRVGEQWEDISVVKSARYLISRYESEHCI